MIKNNTLKCLLLVLAVAALSTATPGCSRKKDDRPQIALVMKSLANEFFKTMEEGARQHQKQNAERYNLIPVGIKNEQDVAKQIDLVELMMARRVDAIVIAPANSEALVPVCKKAVEAGITVVNIDNKLDEKTLAANNVKIPFVGPDNRKGAKLAAEFLAKKLTKGDEVVIIEGAPNAFNGIQRKLGFEDAMNAAQMKIVSSQSGYWEPAKANQVASSLITEHPQLKAILCANDSMALGAVAALEAADKTDDILVIGFDNISAVRQMLKNNTILCTVDQHADRIAVFGIDYALEMLEQGRTPVDRETPVDLITAETLK